MAIDALETAPEAVGQQHHAANWAKGKRSKRQRSPPAPHLQSTAAANAAGEPIPEDVYELAACLVALSRHRRDMTSVDEGSSRGLPVASPAVELNHSSGSVGRRPGTAAASPAREPFVIPTPAKPTSSYPCSECGKSFSSYQALGGHKTSHRKPPSTAVAFLPGVVGVNGLSAPFPASTASGGEKLHQCTICLRVFPTGQALGGHKRLHYDGGASAAAAAISATAAATSSTTVTTMSEAQHKVELDLNAPALPEIGFAGRWTPLRQGPATKVAEKRRQEAEEEGEVLSPLPPSSKKPRFEITSYGGMLAVQPTPLINFF